jgi:hypothetical protein
MCARFGEAATCSPGGIEGFVNLHLMTFDPNDPDLCQNGHLGDKPGATFSMCVKFCQAATKSPGDIKGFVNLHLVIFDLDLDLSPI